jgi:hypothetical protein
MLDMSGLFRDAEPVAALDAWLVLLENVAYVP